MTRVVNESSYPSKTVERLVRSTLRDLEVQSSALTVIVRDARPNKWAKEQHVSGYWEYLGGAWGRAEIVVRIPPPGHPLADYVPYERQRDPGRRFPLADWREALVAVVAHEGEHHRQRAVLGERPGRRTKTRGGRVVRYGTGTRRTDVESRCDLAAYRAWVRYRQARKLDYTSGVDIGRGEC